MKYFIIAILFFSCGTTQQVSGPTIYIHDTATVIHTIYIDSLVRDTIDIKSTDTIRLSAQVSKSVYELPLASGSDDYAILQSNIDNAIKLGYKVIHISGKGYRMSHGLSIKDAGGSFVEGIYLYGDGGDYSGVPTFTVTNGQTYGLNIIRGKGCIVKGITMAGQNTGLLTYSVGRVLSGDTSSFVTNGVSALAAMPHAGFVVDGLAYGDAPKTIVGGGSTDIQFVDCRAQYFTVCFCLQPGGQVQNGEIIKIENCWGDYCRSAISTGQTQQRTVLVNNFHCWGWTKTVFDCVNFAGTGACPPEVYGLNVAGCVRYLVEQGQWISKGLIVSNSHIESLWSLGGCFFGNSNTLTLRDNWISLQGKTGGILPPSVIYMGGKIIVDGGFLWQYGSGVHPLSFNCYYADFNNVELDAIPIMVDRGDVCTFRNCIANGYRFGDDLVVSQEKSAAELSTATFIWMGRMSCKYSGSGGERGWGTIRTRVNGTTDQEYFIPQLIIGDLTKGSNIIKNVLVEGGLGFANPPMLYMTELSSGTTIISKTDSTIVLSAPALVSENNAAILSGNWKGESVGTPPNIANPYRYGWKIGDHIVNNDFAHYPDVLRWTCIRSGITGTINPPFFKPE